MDRFKDFEEKNGTLEQRIKDLLLNIENLNLENQNLKENHQKELKNLQDCFINDKTNLENLINEKHIAEIGDLNKEISEKDKLIQNQIEEINSFKLEIQNFEVKVNDLKENVSLII